MNNWIATTYTFIMIFAKLVVRNPINNLTARYTALQPFLILYIKYSYICNRVIKNLFKTLLNNFKNIAIFMSLILHIFYFVFYIDGGSIGIFYLKT